MTLPQTMNQLVDYVLLEYSEAVIKNLFSNAEIAANRGDMEAALSSQVALTLILLRKLRDEGFIDLSVLD